MRIRNAVAVVTALTALSAGPAVAGPIAWSYSSQGAQAGVFSLTGTPLTAMRNEQGLLAQLTTFTDFSPQLDPGGVHGSLVAQVTLTDSASNASVTFDVPYDFYKRDYDDFKPVLGGFRGQRFDLGDNTYEITAPGDGSVNYLEVAASGRAPAATPEPASLVMAAVGLAGVGLARLRARRAG